MTEIDPQKRRLLPFVVLFAAVAAGAAAWLFLRSHPSPPAVTAARQPADRPSVAVIGFQNASGEPSRAWLSTALAETISCAVADGDTIRVASGDEVARAMRDLALTSADGMPPESLTALRQLLQVDAIVSGSSFRQEKDGQSQLTLSLKMQRTGNGSTLLSERFTGREQDFFDLSMRGASAIRQKLGAPPLRPPQTARLARAVPSNSVAAESFSSGLDAERSFHPIEAIALFTRALQAAPSSPAVHIALARTLDSIGEGGRAEEEAAAAAAQARELPPIRRMALLSAAAEIQGRLEDAVAAIQPVERDHPDERRIALRLADLLLRLGRTEEATAILDRQKTSSRSSVPDPRLSLLEARLASRANDPSTWHSAALKAAAEAKAVRATLLLGRARMEEAGALAATGRYDEALQAYDKGLNICEFLGDRVGVVSAMAGKARVAMSRSDLAGGRALFGRAVAEARSAGMPGVAGAVLLDLAGLEDQKGTASEARRARSEALAVFRSANNERAAAAVLHDLAVADFSAGDRAAARKGFEEALPVLKRSSDKERTASAMEYLGEILFRQGDVGAASVMLQDALHVRRETANRREIANALMPLGMLFQVQGNPIRARNSFNETVIIRESLRETLPLADSHIAIAGLLVDQGMPDDAATEAQKAVQSLESAGDADRLARALAVLAESQLLKGNNAAAAATIARASSLMSSMKGQAAKDDVALAAARIEAAASPARSPAARTSVEAVLARAKREGDVPLALRCQLAIAEITARAGDAAGAASQLGALEEEARKRSFVSIAEKAERLRAK